MKKLLLLIVLFTTPFVWAEEQTQPRTIDRIQMSASGTYYFSTEKGWGAPGCPNAAHIFFYKHEVPAADGLLSLMLSSQALNRSIIALGNCTDSNHFKLTYIIQQPAQ
ncbi:hypothetical protein OPW19_20030 [Vibrio europaeus]|uniref:hypothetical protein n=1 Tax=Vibrio europaeus TaxID=300876 RepID=UPI00233F2F4B|nr:hypothetical protein [Vibrio europaeus]MDC5822105.1 hypothetical protein [Vibrio europaeus]MDC5870048.1 hypothetical protein [Vibrio europaeus]